MARKRALTRDTRTLWDVCQECGSPLDRTPGGYLCCPLGHGKLVADAPLPVAETNLFSRRCACGADLGNESASEVCSECQENPPCESSEMDSALEPWPSSSL